jgi:hypothetical protein
VETVWRDGLSALTEQSEISSGAFSTVEYRDFSPTRELMYDLALSRLIVTVKFFPVISRVEWLNSSFTLLVNLSLF